MNWDITALYTKYDAQKLAAMVGNERAAQMIHAQKNVHMFVTGYTWTLRRDVILAIVQCQVINK